MMNLKSFCKPVFQILDLSEHIVISAKNQELLAFLKEQGILSKLLFLAHEYEVVHLVYQVLPEVLMPIGSCLSHKKFAIRWRTV